MGEVAWEMLPERQRHDVAKRFAEAVLEEHPEHPATQDERPALAARAYLRAGLAETALPLLATAVRNEQTSGRTATGLEVAELWVDTARAAGRAEELGRALDRRVGLATLACDWPTAERDLDELEQLAGDDLQALLRVHTSRAVLAKYSQDFERVVEAVEEAFSTALMTDAPRETLFQLSDLIADVDFRSGSLVAARDRWAGLAHEARSIVNPYWEMVGRANAAGADAQLGLFDAAASGFRKARRLAEDQCDQITGLLLELELARLHGLRGDPGRARADVLAVLQQAGDLGAVRVVGQATTTLGELCRRLELFDEAETYLARAERVLRTTEQRVTLADLLPEPRPVGGELGVGPVESLRDPIDLRLTKKPKQVLTVARCDPIAFRLVDRRGRHRRSPVCRT